MPGNVSRRVGKLDKEEKDMNAKYVNKQIIYTILGVSTEHSSIFFHTRGKNSVVYYLPAFIIEKSSPGGSMPLWYTPLRTFAL